MDNINESHAVVTQAAYGDAARYPDRIRPTLEPDGQIHMDPEDGRILADVKIRSVIQYVSTVENSEDLVEMMYGFARERNLLRMFHFRLVVTEARLIWEQTKPASPPIKVVGHLRFPWIRDVGFRPKQSFLNDPMIRLEFHEDFPVAALGAWFHYVELGFHKGVHPGSLAQLVAQQIARHHLKHGAPDSATQALEALATAVPLADPPKGEEAHYFMPVSATYPGCVDYIGDGIVGGEWNVDESTATGPAGSDNVSPSW